MRTALIQGSGGIGQALAQVVVDQGAFDRVILAGRGAWVIQDPKGLVQTVQLDLTDDRSIQVAADQVAASCDRLHLVVTTAGLLTDPERGIFPEKKLTDLTREAFRQVLDLNCVGPFLWLKALFPLLKHRDPMVIATLSARVGSIGDNRLGGWHSYRASKAAQNMLTRNLALELGRTNPQAIVVGLHPGTVDTALSKPYQKGVTADHLFSPDHAAGCLWSVIQELSPAETGSVLDWNHQVVVP